MKYLRLEWSVFRIIAYPDRFNENSEIIITVFSVWNAQLSGKNYGNVGPEQGDFEPTQSGK